MAEFADGNDVCIAAVVKADCDVVRLELPPDFVPELGIAEAGGVGRRLSSGCALLFRCAMENDVAMDGTGAQQRNGQAERNEEIVHERAGGVLGGSGRKDRHCAM